MTIYSTDIRYYFNLGGHVIAIRVIVSCDLCGIMYASQMFNI